MKKINIFLMLSLCILLGGCKSAKEEKAMTREKVKQVMLDYIENKYDEEFEVFGMDYKYVSDLIGFDHFSFSSSHVSSLLSI